ncbi:MAG: hypothetical protein LBS97_05315 [Treponema sp.]|jgi:hypothetical protein|nr:hypothetical protein [Treponema sp.]
MKKQISSVPQALSPKLCPPLVLLVALAALGPLMTGCGNEAEDPPPGEAYTGTFSAVPKEIAVAMKQNKSPWGGTWDHQFIPVYAERPEKAPAGDPAEKPMDTEGLVKGKDFIAGPYVGDMSLAGTAELDNEAGQTWQLLLLHFKYPVTEAGKMARIYLSNIGVYSSEENVITYSYSPEGMAGEFYVDGNGSNGYTNGEQHNIAKWLPTEEKFLLEFKILAGITGNAWDANAGSEALICLPGSFANVDRYTVTIAYYLNDVDIPFTVPEGATYFKADFKGGTNLETTTNDVTPGTITISSTKAITEGQKIQVQVWIPKDATFNGQIQVQVGVNKATSGDNPFDDWLDSNPARFSATDEEVEGGGYLAESEDYKTATVTVTAQKAFPTVAQIIVQLAGYDTYYKGPGAIKVTGY